MVDSACEGFDGASVHVGTYPFMGDCFSHSPVFFIGYFHGYVVGGIESVDGRSARQNFAILQETNVLYSELYCLGCTDLATVVFGESWFSVFSNSQEKVKGNLREISNCSVPWTVAIEFVCFIVKMVGDCDWQG